MFLVHSLCMGFAFYPGHAMVNGVIKIEHARWGGLGATLPFDYTCGHCGVHVSSSLGAQLFRLEAREDVAGNSPTETRIAICQSCGRPTYFEAEGVAPGGVRRQIPGPRPCGDVSHLSNEIERVYNESRECFAAGAYTGSAMMSRTVIMHVAVHLGAPSGQSFASYVTFLENEGALPASAKVWFDQVRKTGNRAAHELAPIGQEVALQSLQFLEMLLKMTFEFPGKVIQAQPGGV